jgi:intracellular septation protein
MQLIVEYLPLILFFAAYKLYGIYIATGVAIGASIGTILYARFKTGKVTPLQWISLVIIGVFGGATIVLHDETFIKWKPSVLYVCMAGALLIGKVFYKKDWLASLFAQANLVLPAKVWTTLTWTWIAFFSFLAALNGYVATHYSLDAWVNFKVWGVMGMMLVFFLGIGVYLSRHMPK